MTTQTKEQILESKEDIPAKAQNKKIEEIIETVKKMNILELSELVKAFEEVFGVSPITPVVSTSAVGTVSSETKPEEKTEFSCILANIGDKKIQVIKEVRVITGLGLKDAKDLVDNAPKPIKEKISKQEAEEIKKKLEAVGATVEIK